MNTLLAPTESKESSIRISKETYDLAKKAIKQSAALLSGLQELSELVSEEDMPEKYKDKIRSIIVKTCENVV
jgi:hypothetical protein